MSRVVSHRLDIKAVRRRLAAHVEHLSADKNVLAVVLFGSLATGDHTVGSDADLLVVLAASDRPFHERLAAYSTTVLGVPADVFVYTADEVGQMVAEGRGIPAVALRDGEVLFRREWWPLPELITAAPRRPGRT